LVLAGQPSLLGRFKVMGGLFVEKLSSKGDDQRLSSYSFDTVIRSHDGLPI